MSELLLKNADWVHLKIEVLLVFLKIQNRPLGASCSFSGVERSYHYVGFVKNQSSVSHSTTEPEVIFLDVGLRMEGIIALDLWDLFVGV